MALIDLLSEKGLKPANFLDVGGGASEEVVLKALDVLATLAPKAILINVYGGITRCDEVAKAVVVHIVASVVVVVVGVLIRVAEVGIGDENRAAAAAATATAKLRRTAVAKAGVTFIRRTVLRAGRIRIQHNQKKCYGCTTENLHGIAHLYLQ